MYVAAKGGERAIANAHQWLSTVRRGDTNIAELDPVQLREQQKLAIDRLMTEGSLYEPDLAALALKQSRGDQVEAIFLLRAFRATLPRWGYALPFRSETMIVKRRISAIFKDVPGGQVLGPTFDYSHRLIDFALHGNRVPPVPEVAPALSQHLPCAIDILERDGLIETRHHNSTGSVIADLTRQPLEFPASRAMRLQNLARGDEGFLLALAYSTQRGYGRNHPFAGEIRTGWVTLRFLAPELGFEIDIGDVEITECHMVTQFVGSTTQPAQFTRGYGIGFGESERKAMAMALVDRALRADEFGEATAAPAQNAEFVLYHSDNVEAQGFVQHLKLPHYVDFQAELNLVRGLREEALGSAATPLQRAAE